MEDGEEAREKIAEIKRRLKEIERKTGKKIDLNKLLKIIFSKENIKKAAKKGINILDQMLKEDINNYVEVGVQEKGPVKIEHGFRIGFLDNDKDKKENDKNQRFFKIHFPKKMKKEKEDNRKKRIKKLDVS